MGRLRMPIIIWLGRARKNHYWKAKRKRQRPMRVPWMSAVLYSATILAALGVLWKAPTVGKALPVSGPLASQPSFLDRAVHHLGDSPSPYESWMNHGIPVVGLTVNHQERGIHWSGLLETGLTFVTGIHWHHIRDIFRVQIPQLGEVAPTGIKSQSAHRRLPSTPPRHREPSAVDKSLPGDGGRVWAELGTHPAIGIYQTHSRESFWSAMPPGSSVAYSTDWPKTIVQVGWWLSEDIHQAGVAVIQSRVDNMSEGLLASYNQSYYTAKRLLRDYPSVRLLIDLHRQANDVPTIDVHGKSVAKILIVVGSNQLLPNPYWHDNYEVALRLATALKKLSPNILVGNGVDTVPYRYNQQLLPGDLMIEVGGPNNTLAQERRAAHILAQALVRLVKDGTNR